MSTASGSEQEAQRSLLHRYNEVQPSTNTISKLVKRLRLLTLKLLPVEVLSSDLTEVTSRIITPQVISAFKDAGGDFVEALPYCLLRARQEFMWEANRSPADYDENYGRAMACEVLARRIVHQTPPEKLTYMMSNRYSTVDWDGDESNLVSALELAVDTHCTVFLSSNESQDIVNSLWKGELVIRRKHHHHMDFMTYQETPGYHKGFFDPSRMCVPRYQNLFRIFVWFFFLGVYSQAVREPLDHLNPKHTHLDPAEVVMYVLALSFAFEDIHKLYKLLRFVTIRSFSFWLIVSLLTDCLFVTAFSLRMWGLWSNQGRDEWLRWKAFQVLSFIAPLIWMKLVTVFDGFKYVGTMQICIARMLQESGIFFGLLSILGIGFAQGLWALDASDEEAGSLVGMIHLLLQALLQAPNYDAFANNPAGLNLFYLWNVATAVILLNVLISLFSSAYDDVVEDAEAEYLAFFAAKTVEMVRAPDSYVYPAPGNIIETLLVAPFELVLSPKSYAKLNRVVLSCVYFIPLVMISFYESVLSSRKNQWLKTWFQGRDDGEDDSDENRDPEVTEHQGMQIATTKFDDLTKSFPDTTLSSEATLQREIRELRSQLGEVLQRLDAIAGATETKERSGRKKSRSNRSRGSD